VSYVEDKQCIVIRNLSGAISNIFGIHLGDDFESVRRWWISNIKKFVINIFSSVVMWLVWSLRNELCFQGKS
jgi:hypothetical protein